MSDNPADRSAPLVGVLEYLQGLGYEDLYKPEASAGTARPPEPEARTAAPEPTPVQPRVPAVERASTLAILGQETGSCTACGLASTRKSVVFGVGDPDADLMFIGEGPGAEEDRQGVPFVGRAGELLTKIVQAIELSRSEVYIANIVKCRPPGNRDPLPDEVAACRGFLERQIDLIQPKVIVALGRVAAQTLLGESNALGRMRGRWYEVRGVETRVTYHPAALLRNAGFKRPTWEDMQIVRDRLNELKGGPSVS